jgi:uncharacterized protein
MTDLGLTDFFYDPLKRDTLIDTDPFRGSATQTNRMRAYAEVWVDGVDITSKIEPHLISIRIVDGTEKAVELEIDDRDAKLPIPPLIAPVRVLLGWARESMFKMFNGKIMDFEHGFGRKQGGRRMWVHAKGTDVLTTKLKQPMQLNLGEGAPPGKKEGQKHGMPSWIQKLVSKGGGSAEVASKFAANMQDYWQANGASPMHEAMSLADKFGAMHQWDEGNVLKFEVPGQRGVSCRAIWGDNLIGWRVRPFQARTAFASASQQNFDKFIGEWQKRFQDASANIKGGPGGAAQADNAPAGAAATESAANQENDGAGVQMDNAAAGVGRIVINGEPPARFNSLVHLQGARPGVDGIYLIRVAEHIYSRQGYVTWLDVTPFAETHGRDSVYSGWLPRPALNVG